MSQSFDGFVWGVELAEKANVTLQNFSTINSLKIRHMGSLRFIEIKSLPKKYQKVALSCHNYGDYLSFTFFNELLGLNKDSIFQRERATNVTFKGFRINKKRFIKISKSFKKYWNDGYVPFLIEEDTKEDAEHIINMQGLEIGFY